MKKLLLVIYGTAAMLIFLGHQLAQAQMVSSSSGFRMCPTGEVKLAVHKEQVTSYQLAELSNRGFDIQLADDFYFLTPPGQLMYTSQTCKAYSDVKTYLEGTVAFIGLGAAIYGVYVTTFPISVTVTLAGAAGATAIMFVTDKFVCNTYYEEEDEKKTKMIVQESVCEILSKQNNNKNPCLSSGGNLIRLENGSLDNMCKLVDNKTDI